MNDELVPFTDDFSPLDKATDALLTDLSLVLMPLVMLVEGDVSSSPLPTPATSAPLTPKPSEDIDYLMMMEPCPVSPPLYSTLPPGGSPRFNVVDLFCPNDHLPSYTPLVYKMACVSRKPEWALPFVPATHRQWKYVVAELNLTQLNFYAVPASMEQVVLTLSSVPPPPTPQFRDVADLDSVMTTIKDLQMHVHCQRLGLFEKAVCVKLYSLQHAKFGLATDYKKKLNVLRIRVEQEQILLAFNSVQEVIDWNMALLTGRDLSLDVNEREMPKYRTVPRRRRRRRRHTTSNAAMEVFAAVSAPTRPRSSLDPALLFRKLKRKFSLTNLSGQGQSATVSPAALPTLSTTLQSSFASRSPSRSRSLSRAAEDDEEQEDLEMADFEVEDDDEDDILGDEVVPPCPRVSLPDASSRFVKWRPDNEVMSRHRHIKHCLRCIKPLQQDDSWVGKPMVRPSEVSDHLVKMKMPVPQSHGQLREYIVGAQGLVPRVY